MRYIECFRINRVEARSEANKTSEHRSTARFIHGRLNIKEDYTVIEPFRI